ncbi:MAG TPA: ATP-binding protein [Bacteroidales bacterium]|nr:ATP-binding protein [Bacteroidales bacterium]HSA43013.1 ATP-binding protein [Bacteroidales bacterium]
MEIAVISGKGGTGKSSVTAALASCAGEVVLADCDVDAANQYLLFMPEIEEEQVYVSGYKAVIREDVCDNCGLCMQYCRFQAIHLVNGQVRISETACDGCRLCARVCPAGAVEMHECNRSRMVSGSFRKGRMVYGRLAPGEENTGKLVSMVRNKARELAAKSGIPHILIDGPPGIGCPVISSITGTDLVIIVTEAGISGFHDLKRALEITGAFQVKTWVLINKYDLNPEWTESISEYCQEKEITVAAKLPFDPLFTDAMVHQKSVIEWAPEKLVSRQLSNLWEMITANAEMNENGLSAGIHR